MTATTTTDDSAFKDVEVAAAGGGSASSSSSLPSTKPPQDDHDDNMDTSNSVTSTTTRRRCCVGKFWTRRNIGLALLYTVLLASTWMASSSLLLSKRHKTRVYQVEQTNKGYGYRGTTIEESGIIPDMDELMDQYERGITVILEFYCLDTKLRDAFDPNAVVPRQGYVQTVHLAINPAQYYWVKGYTLKRADAGVNVVRALGDPTYDLRDAVTHQAVLKLRSNGMINGKPFMSGLEESFCQPMFDQMAQETQAYPNE